MDPRWNPVEEGCPFEYTSMTCGDVDYFLASYYAFVAFLPTMQLTCTVYYLMKQSGLNLGCPQLGREDSVLALSTIPTTCKIKSIAPLLLKSRYVVRQSSPFDGQVQFCLHGCD